MNPEISILIPTHNRPKLFKRALNSVLNNRIVYPIEVIVNNDTDDIVEIYHDDIDIRYFYEKHLDISRIYKTLFDHARGRFVYYLEDDDYLRDDFFTNLDLTYDINYFEYISNDLLRYMHPVKAFKRIACNRSQERDLSKFLKDFDDTDFQLGQILFKKDKLTTFPVGNNIHNDWYLFKQLAREDCTIKYIYEQKWVQTFDGGDNISFPEFNKDERFC